MPKSQVPGINLTYDLPRIGLLFGHLEKTHKVTVDQPRPRAMDFELRHESKCIHLSLHVATGKKGFWGLGEKTFEFLNEVDRWLITLLLRREDSHIADGWLINEQQWMTFRPSISMDQKGNYKINRHNLVEDEKLSGLEKIVREIAAYLKSG